MESRVCFEHIPAMDRAGENLREMSESASAAFSRMEYRAAHDFATAAHACAIAGWGEDSAEAMRAQLRAGVTGVFASAGGEETETETHFRLAIDASANLARIGVQCARMQNLLGLMHERRGDLGTARVHYDAAIAIVREEVEAWSGDKRDFVFICTTGFLRVLEQAAGRVEAAAKKRGRWDRE